MFVLVQHYVTDVHTFWAAVRHAVPTLPPYLRLHHCFPTKDGSHAVCVWEADSIRDVRSFLETYVGHVGRTLYFPVENAGGIAAPSEVVIAERAG